MLSTACGASRHKGSSTPLHKPALAAVTNIRDGVSGGVASLGRHPATLANSAFSTPFSTAFSAAGGFSPGCSPGFSPGPSPTAKSEYKTPGLCSSERIPFTSAPASAPGIARGAVGQGRAVGSRRRGEGCLQRTQSLSVVLTPLRSLPAARPSGPPAVRAPH